MNRSHRYLFDPSSGRMRRLRLRTSPSGFMGVYVKGQILRFFLLRNVRLGAGVDFPPKR